MSSNQQPIGSVELTGTAETALSTLATNSPPLVNGRVPCTISALDVTIGDITVVGGATEAKQDSQITLATTGNATLASINGALAAPLPLPTGAATGAKQDIGNASLAAIDAALGAPLPLPTGASSAARQDTGNNSLSSIDTKLSSTATAARQDTGNNSLAAIDAKLGASLPLPTGAATEAKQDTGNATLSSLDAKTPNLAGGASPVSIRGFAANGNTASNVQVDTDGTLHVDPVGTGAFGELITAELDARVQIDAIYGILDTDHETFTASGGTATVTGGMFSTATGTNVGAYGVIRSRRLIRYRPGQGVRARFTAMYSTPAALGFQHAGLFTASDALTFGYNGTTFGILRRIAGASEIRRLTVTVGAGGVETITVTLNGVAFVLPATAGALSAAATAEYIAEATTYTGWASVASPQSNGATVTWIQNTPGTTGGAFSVTSTGTAAGTFATLQAGSPNDDTTGFIPQTSWNFDTMDGSGGAANPSGVNFIPSNLNVFEITYPYLGAGPIAFKVMANDGEFRLVHRIPYANANQTPNQRNPTYRLGWIAASLGSASNLQVQGASAAGFVEGLARSARDPFAQATSFTAGTTEYVALALRVRGQFASRVNLREVLPHTLSIGIETSNRVVRARCILNPVLTGTVNWQYVDENRSAVEYATPTTLAPSNGRAVAARVASSGQAAELELHELDLRLEPGDVLAVTLVTVSGSAVCDVGLNWQEK